MVQCAFITQDWDNLLPGLEARQYDAVMAALEINDERSKRVAFSTPYVRMPASFLVGEGSDLTSANTATLAGKTIGVEDQSAAQTFLEDEFKTSKIRRYATLEEAILDLAEDKVDAVLADKSAIADFLKNRKEALCCKLLNDAPRNPATFGEGIGIGVRKDDEALNTAFNGALDSLIADGSFQRITRKYFDFDIR